MWEITTIPRCTVNDKLKKKDKYKAIDLNVYYMGVVGCKSFLLELLQFACHNFVISRDFFE